MRVQELWDRKEEKLIGSWLLAEDQIVVLKPEYLEKKLGPVWESRIMWIHREHVPGSRA